MRKYSEVSLDIGKSIDLGTESLVLYQGLTLHLMSYLDVNGEFSEKGAYVGATILWICAIDFFDGLLTGCYKQRETRRRITTFVSCYLKKYGAHDPNKLYDLRWSLVHFYTVRHYTLD